MKRLVRAGRIKLENPLQVDMKKEKRYILETAVQFLCAWRGGKHISSNIYFDLENGAWSLDTCQSSTPQGSILTLIKAISDLP